MEHPFVKRLLLDPSSPEYQVGVTGSFAGKDEAGDDEGKLRGCLLTKKEVKE